MLIKVKFLQSLSGATFSHSVNEVTSVPQEYVGPWVRSGICEVVEDKKTPAKTPAQLKAEKAAADAQAVADKKAAEDAQFERELAELEAAEKKTAPAATTEENLN